MSPYTRIVTCFIYINEKEREREKESFKKLYNLMGNRHSMLYVLIGTLNRIANKFPANYLSTYIKFIDRLLYL